MTKPSWTYEVITDGGAYKVLVTKDDGSFVEQRYNTWTGERFTSQAKAKAWATAYVDTLIGIWNQEREADLAFQAALATELAAREQ
jgi:hypothetical protein